MSDWHDLNPCWPRSTRIDWPPLLSGEGVRSYLIHKFSELGQDYYLIGF